MKNRRREICVQSKGKKKRPFYDRGLRVCVRYLHVIFYLYFSFDMDGRKK